MRAASAPNWSWPARSVLLAALVGALPPALAQQDSLKLKLSTQLSRVPQIAVTEVLMQVDINRQRINQTLLLLRAPDGELYISGEDLQRFRLRRPAAPALEHEGRAWYALSALAGATYELNARTQSLAISAPSEAFEGMSAAVPQLRYPPPLLPQPGGFLNYTLSATRAGSAQTESGLFEAGFFSRYGVLTSGMLAPDLGERSSWIRLDSTYTVDFPERRETLRLGDSISRPGAWGLPLRFGGLQYGTNFATQPGFVRFPIQSASGSAVLPSTVDVFVNNALVSRTQVPPGPFSITNIPMVSGSGDVQLVVRDLLGREHVIVQRFYGSSELLKAGLDDWSVEAGAARRGFGVRSNDYGAALGAATWRRGLTDGLTAELRGEAEADTQAAGASALGRIGELGMLTTTLAASRSPAGTGQLLGYGFEHTSRGLSGALQSQHFSPQFRQAGAEDFGLRARQTIASLGYSFGAFGSASLAYAQQVFRDQPEREVATLSYSMPVAGANLSLAASRSFGPDGATSVFATLTIPLGNLTSASLVVDRSRSERTGETRDSYSALLQKSPPLGEGYGYRLQARDSDLLAAGTLNTSVATWTAELAHPRQDSPDAVRLGVAGGIGLVGRYPFLSRTITDSFGVVRVADYPNVHVLHENQPIARTDDRGYAVLPRLRPYDRNQVTIDQRDLPLDARVDGLRLEAVPYYRSGVLIDFPVHRVRAATFHIMLEDGSALPSGALVRLEGATEEFPVALKGEVYLEGLADKNRAVVTWRGQSCTLDIAYPRTEDPLPDLGTHICRGVGR
jgi:outer membrane usher protein